VTVITITQILAFAFFNIISLAYVTSFDRLITAFAESQPQVNSISNLTDQIGRLKNLAANQSSELRDIKKLNSEEVQLLKSMSDVFSKTLSTTFRIGSKPYLPYVLHIGMYSNLDGITLNACSCSLTRT